MQMLWDPHLAKLNVVAHGKNKCEEESILGNTVPSIPLSGREHQPVIPKVHLVGHVFDIAFRHRVD